jgi:prevent-host-death family protein
MQEERIVFMPKRASLNLSVDLQGGVVPISKAASSLAALIKRINATEQPVIVTQKGYPTGVLLPIGLFTALKGIVDDQGEPAVMPAAADADDSAEVPVDESAAVDDQASVPEEAPAPAPRRRTGGRRKRAEDETTEVVA